jgi:hypothetical protein
LASGAEQDRVSPSATPARAVPEQSAMKTRHLLALAPALVSAGCSNVVVPGGAGGCSAVSCSSSSLYVLQQSQVDKIDLLFVIDNSGSMADKQQALSVALPDMLAGILNPRCLDDATGTSLPVAAQPSGPLAACPGGSSREFPPVLDVHVGVLSSSLGTFGVASGCSDAPDPQCPNATTTPQNDHGHLVTRSDGCNTRGPIPTYQESGFLAWDPAGTLSPAGLATLGVAGTGPGTGSGILGAFHDIVVGNGAEGCGVTSQNEAWYRFLVDPAPYESIAMVANQARPSGVDTALLEQRKRFLRPDSMLVIVNVTGKPDGSLKESGFYPLYADFGQHLPHATSACALKGPSDPCCASCGEATPSGCAPDLACSASPTYTDTDENTALRRFGLVSDKERYGIEFFYPPSRYVAALTSPTVADATGAMVPNPIYSNLDFEQSPGAVRDPGLVIYTAVVGVPWQLVARQNAQGAPDLLAGVSALDPTQVGGLRTSAELGLTDAQGHSLWSDIAGDPESYVAAGSPFMVESTTPRAGRDPITGAAIAPPSTPNGGGASVGGALLNDHERTLAAPPDDIEYACVFPLADALPPSNASDCVGAGAAPDSPLCSANPADGMRDLQTSAKAYPGVKHLAIARGLGAQGVASSICPKQLTDPSSDDYGYRPALHAITPRLRAALAGKCLPEPLATDAHGQVACVVLEGRTADTCDCQGSASRVPVSAEHLSIQQNARATPQGSALSCFCEVEQASGASLTACETTNTPFDGGFCYVDGAAGPGEAAVTSKCPSNEQHLLRFGSGVPGPRATLFIACAPGS